MRGRETDAQEPRRHDFRPATFVVTLRSRGGQQVEVTSKSDREFLELADEFVIAAEKIERDPSRKVPRLSLR